MGVIVVATVSGFGLVEGTTATPSSMYVLESDGTAERLALIYLAVNDDLPRRAEGRVFPEEERVFEFVDVANAPLGGNHTPDRIFLQGIAGEHPVPDGVAKAVKSGAGLVREHDGDEHAVFSGVLGGVAFSHKRDGAFGLFPVGARGGDLSFGARFRDSNELGCRMRIHARSITERCASNSTALAASLLESTA